MRTVCVAAGARSGDSTASVRLDRPSHDEHRFGSEVVGERQIPDDGKPVTRAPASMTSTAASGRGSVIRPWY